MTTQPQDIKINEKRERFVRIAEARTSRAIKSVRLIRNLNNAYLYEYAPEEIDLIIAALQNEVDDLKRAFSKKKPTQFRIDKTELPFAV